MNTRIDGTSVAGAKLKEKGTTHWESPNVATNETGFSALPSGLRSHYGEFVALGESTFLWSSRIVAESDNPYFWLITYEFPLIYESDFYLRSFGLSIRCIKD